MTALVCGGGRSTCRAAGASCVLVNEMDWGILTVGLGSGFQSVIFVLKYIPVVVVDNAGHVSLVLEVKGQA